MKFYNDWISYDYKDLVVDQYPPENTPPDMSMHFYLYKQAKAIAAEVENPIVFVSGGIDSQAVAKAFKNIPGTRFIFICPIFREENGTEHICKEELFYAKSFAKQNGIELEIVQEIYTQDSLRDFLEERNFWNTGTGAGTIFQLPVIERERKNGYPITADGHFIFTREGSKCSGIFKKPGLVLSEGIKLENQILFDFYAPYMFFFYEMKHRATPELQYKKRIEAKNLIYTDLGFPLRPKLSGWEFLLGPLGISLKGLSTIDWSNDHSRAVRQHLPRGPEVIGKLLHISKDVIKNKLKIQRENDQSRYIQLYEFEKTF